MHPQNLVFNPPTLKRLVEQGRRDHVGAEMDPSHLFWQGMDPVAAVRYLGPLVVHAAAKDVRINPSNATIYGVLDDRFRRLSPDEPGSTSAATSGSTSGRRTRPGTSSRSAAGTTSSSGPVLEALREVDPDMAVNIEHEDTSLGRIEGLEVAAEVLRKAASA
jgi:sugar phosphate isomerase/epimerase